MLIVPREAAAHEHVRRCAGDVARVEPPAGNERDADHVEVVAGDDALLRGRRVRRVHARQRPGEGERSPGVIRARGGQPAHAPRALHAGERRQRGRHALVEPRARRGVVARVGQVQLERQHARGAHAEVDLAEALHARDQHAGAGEEHERERHLRDDEAIAHAHRSGAARRRSSGLAAQRLRRPRARHAQRRREPERHGAERREGEREGEQPRLQRECLQTRDGALADVYDRRHRALRHREPGEVADGGEGEALDEELPHDPAAGGA